MSTQPLAAVQPALTDSTKHSVTKTLAAQKKSFSIILAVVALYIFWSMTYPTIRVALGSFPPFIMGSIRNLIAGGLMFGYLLVRKSALPTLKQWLGATIVAGFLILGGNGTLLFAEDMGIGSGFAAVALGVMPLWVALFSGLFGRWPTRLEWGGLALGFTGLILLNIDHGLSANLTGLLLVIASPVLWAFGSVISKRLPMPVGAMSSAAQMLCGGIMMAPLALVTGEHMSAWPTTNAMLCFIFLIFGGSIAGYTAYSYLLKNARPTLATSYAYVNPAGAMLIGVFFLSEHFTIMSIFATLVILSGVVLVTLGRDAK
jgi:drug/metabolite transporter (DMT)-like permease